MSSHTIPTGTAEASSARPFYIAGSVLAMAAVAAVGWLFTDQARRVGEPVGLAVIVAGVILLLSAAWMFVWPARMRLMTAPFLDLPTAFMDARAQLIDVQAVRKEYNKVRTDIEGFTSLVEQALVKTGGALYQTLELIQSRQEALDRAIFDRKKADQEMMELRQSVGEARRESEEWQKAAIRFSEGIQRIAHPESGIGGAYIEAAAKLAKDFDRIFKRLGLSLIIPEINEPFEEGIHEAAGEVERDDVTEGFVGGWESWGYQTRASGVKVKARVLLARPTPRPVVASRPRDEKVAESEITPQALDGPAETTSPAQAESAPHVPDVVADAGSPARLELVTDEPDVAADTPPLGQAGLMTDAPGLAPQTR